MAPTRGNRDKEEQLKQELQARARLAFGKHIAADAAVSANLESALDPSEPGLIAADDAERWNQQPAHDVAADTAPIFTAQHLDTDTRATAEDAPGSDSEPSTSPQVRRGTPRPPMRHVPMVFAGQYYGLDLTLFIGKRGRAIGFGKRPSVSLPASSSRIPNFLGRHLTVHRTRKGRATALDKLTHTGPLKRISPWLAIWNVLRWLFSLRIKVLVIERYIFGEAIGYFLLGAMGFTFFMIVTSIFSLGEKIFSKHIPPFTITKVLLLSAPAFLVLAIPVAVLFSTLMAMGRLNRDNEIVAMTTNGVSLYRIFIPFIVIAFTAGLMTWLIYEHVVPPNNQQYKDVLKSFWEAQVVDFIKPQIVIKAPQRKYFYVDWIDKTEGIMYNLRLYDYFGESGQMRHFPRMYIAERAWIADGYLVLSKVRLINLEEDNGQSATIAAMPEVKIDIGTQLSEYQTELHPTEMTSTELRLRISMNRDRLASMSMFNSDLQRNYFRDWTEYYFKYSIPVACLVLVLVAVPVSLRGPRDERNMGIILSFLLLMIYYIIYFSCRVLGSRGPVLMHDVAVGGKTLLAKGANLFPPYVAGWLPATLFFLWALYLIWRARK